MKILTIVLVLLIVVILGIYLSSTSKNKAHNEESIELSPEKLELLKRNIEHIDTATYWLIENGISAHKEFGGKKYLDKICLGFGTQIMVQLPEESDKIDAFYLQGGSRLHHNVLLIQREEILGKVYEYWVINMYTAFGDGDYYGQKFILTEADNTVATRKILNESSVFVDTYLLKNDTSFLIEIADLGKVYRMKTWEYPEHYPNHPELTEKEVYIKGEKPNTEWGSKKYNPLK